MCLRCLIHHATDDENVPILTPLLLFYHQPAHKKHTENVGGMKSFLYLCDVIISLCKKPILLPVIARTCTSEYPWLPYASSNRKG